MRELKVETKRKTQLLDVTDEARALVATRKVPLACAATLVRIAEGEPLLADLTVSAQANAVPRAP